MNNFHFVPALLQENFRCFSRLLRVTSVLKRNEHSSKDSSSITDKHILLTKRIWDYLKIGHTITKSDVIMVLGNHDLRTAQYGAELWLQGMAPWILFSGKEGANTRGKWKKSEAEVFSNLAESLGVSRRKILLEPNATNTGENVKFSFEVLVCYNK